MERWIEIAVSYATVFVPLLALWAVLGLYTLRSGDHCVLSEIAFYFSMLVVAGITLRTVMADDGCWLIHTSSLGVMIVAGVMRRPDSAQSISEFGYEVTP